MTTIQKLSTAACVLLFFASRASAAGPASVLVVVSPKDSAAKRAAQYMSYGFRDVLSKSGGKYQMAPLGALYGDRDVDTNRIQKDADALAAEGLSAYDSLEIDKAQQKFDEGLALFEGNLGEFDSVKPAARLALLSAGAALVNNNEKLGRTLIGRALLYDPNVQPDPRIYNSAMLGIFKDVRNKATKGQKGVLQITTNPSYAELYIDGEFIGMTPDKIDRVDVGPHLVRVVRDGFRPTAEVVDVKVGGKDTNATLNLVAMPQQLQVQGMVEKAVADLGKPTSSSASALAAKGRALYVLVVSVAVNGDQVKVSAGAFHADNRRIGVRDRSFSSMSETYRDEAQFLWDQLQGDIGKAAASPEASRTGAVSAEERIQRGSRAKPIVTGLLLGLGGAALVTGGVFGILAMIAAGPYRMLEQTSPAVAGAQADLQLKALMADILLFSGAAIATAGILCLVLWDDRPANSKTLGALPFQLDFGVTASGGFVGARGTF